ncbi:sel1 repeat family protein [Billgrantia azerbaijanica]|nr:sel1 repeat family protein [Halomonas azerbaijanica]
MRNFITLLPISLLLGTPTFSSGNGTSDLSYESYINSDKRIKCLYGYAAEKTGDHTSAIKIFEDCIQRWNDVYSMIWLAQIYESGIGIPQDLAYATELMRRGAMTNDEAGYSSLARYHYGIALYEGRGTPQNKEEGIEWLRRAASEGFEDALIYLEKLGIQQ